MRKTLRTKTTKLLTFAVVIIALMIVCASYAFAETKTYSRYTGSTYTHDSSLDGYIVVDGIDVSGFQGKIDWAKVKADGIDFAIIRAGGRFYVSGGFYSDDRFVENLKGAKKNGIMVGIYFFSQANTKKMAREEVDYTIKLLEEAGYTAKDLDLPIFMDYESAGGSDALLYNLTQEQGTKVAKEWMSYAVSKGFTPGIYTDLYFGQTKVNGKTLSKDYNYWAAQYYIKNQFAFEYCWWQYASNGRVNGITENTCDMDYWYINPTPPSSATSGGGTGTGTVREHSGFMESEEAIAGTAAYSLTDATVTLSGVDDLVYDGTVKKPTKVTVRYNGVKLTKNTDYKLRYIKNVHAGTAYAVIIGMGQYADYLTVPYKIAKSADLESLTISEIPDMTYTGGPIIPAVTITEKNGRTLVKNADYTVKCTDNTNVGTATMTITFKDEYKGTITLNFNIVRASQTIKIKDARTETVVEDGPYDLGVSTKFVTGVTYTSSDEAVATVDETGRVTPLKAGVTEITVKTKSTKNIKSATKKITLTVTKRGLTESQKKLRDAVKAMDFTLTAKKTSNGIELSWVKNGTKKLDKIQIYKSTVLEAGYKRIYSKAGTATTYVNRSKYLEKGTTYYYKIRGYRIINNKKYYTKWSNLTKKKWS
ncbi:MAG: Ig-like domain-containing protein [Firmicutes bacterium]|nr:Ig-like domain-containing protein [Bacillota bacterium]